MRGSVLLWVLLCLSCSIVIDGDEFLECSCPNSGEFCVEDRCVQCVGDDDCDPQNPACGASGECTGCTSSAVCATNHPGSPVCDTINGNCTGCSSDDDCTQPTLAQCDTDSGECLPCTDNAHCATVDDASLCVETVCVQCTADDETSCNGNTCDPSTNTCTSIAQGSVGTCEPCLTDSACSETARCVEMFLGAAPVGGHCLQIATEGCPERQQWLLLDRVGVSDDTPRTFCGVNESVTTCDAVLHFFDTCSNNNQCGNTGVCTTVNSTPDRCTFPCVQDVIPECGLGTGCFNDLCGNV